MYATRTISSKTGRDRALAPLTIRAPFALLVLVGLLLGAAGVRAADEFLPVEQAFPVTATADGPNAARVHWEVANGYYLYRAKLRFISRTPGVVAGKPELPAAETKHDAFFGEVPIYHGPLEVVLPIERAAGSGDSLDLEVGFQGCADAGFCYPPHRQVLKVALPALATTIPGLPAPAPEPPPATQRIGVRDALGPQPLGLADDDIPTVDQAFRFDAQVTDPSQLKVHWDLAPGTYLYRSKVDLSLEGAEGVTLGPFELPPGDIEKDSILPDGSTGDVEVYHNQVDLSLPLVRQMPEATEIALVAKYQGCAERGICYPPQTRRIRLSLPGTAGATPLAAVAIPAIPAATLPVASASAKSPGEPVSEQDRIAAVLAGGSLWAVVALFFGFGLLLAFTPCVFPMIPILSGIIAGQGSEITTRRAFVLSLVYVLAMALTYTVAGVLAGLFGANIQAAFQNPWVLSAFALVFVALALSMFGFYELQLPSALQSRIAELSNRQEGGTLIGVAIMGLLSALIVGPCVAPPLAGALIFIGQTGDALLGGVALFFLSLGMGAPLIAIGTSAGKLLPRAGAWMDAVKAVFGVGLLGVAILLLERILPAALSMLLWGLLLICSAVYLGALSQLSAAARGWSRLWKGLGVAMLIYGALMLVGAAAGGKDTLQPLRGLAVLGGAGGASAIPHAGFKRIKSAADLDRELAAARAAGRPVMLDFYADWCVSCKEMERDTFSDPVVQGEMARFVLLQADVTANDSIDQALMQGRFELPGPPAILFFDPAGAELRGFRLVGFKPAGEFAAHLRQVAP